VDGYHRHRTSSPEFTSETGIVIVVVRLTMAYWGETTLAVGGVFRIPSGRNRRSINVVIDHCKPSCAESPIGAHAAPTCDR